MAENRRADRLRKLMEDGRAEQSSQYERYLSNADGRRPEEEEVWRGVKGALDDDAREKLGEMARVSVTLGVMPSPSSIHMGSDGQEEGIDVTTVLGRKIMELTQQLLSLQNQLEELTALSGNLELERAQAEIDIAKLIEPVSSTHVDDDEDSHTGLQGQYTLSDLHDGGVPLETLAVQTQSFTASTKHLNAKLVEYQKRISALQLTLEAQRQNEGETTIEDVKHREDDVEAKAAGDATFRSKTGGVQRVTAGC